MLSVYVDDFTLAGPIAEHEGFWTELTKDVSLDPPAGLGRVLGRHHDLIELPEASGENAAMRASPQAMAFNMVDYAKQRVELYESFSSAKKLRHASTPFCPEGSLISSDDDEQGELAGEGP